MVMMATRIQRKTQNNFVVLCNTANKIELLIFTKRAGSKMSFDMFTKNFFKRRKILEFFIIPHFYNRIFNTIFSIRYFQIAQMLAQACSNDFSIKNEVRTFDGWILMKFFSGIKLIELIPSNQSDDFYLLIMLSEHLRSSLNFWF